MTEAKDIITQWLEFFREYDIVGSGEPLDVTRQNVFLFSADQETMDALSVEDISGFIESAYIPFNEALKTADASMCCYSWFDWQSSTLRFCASFAEHLRDLPFGGAFEVTSHPAEIASLFKHDPYREGGIPIFDEEEQGSLEEDADEGPLLVFSKMIGRQRDDASTRR